MTISTLVLIVKKRTKGSLIMVVGVIFLWLGVGFLGFGEKKINRVYHDTGDAFRTSYTETTAPNPFGYYLMMGGVLLFCFGFLGHAFTAKRAATDPVV